MGLITMTVLMIAGYFAQCEAVGGKIVLILNTLVLHGPIVLIPEWASSPRTN
jgi:hypothetical protein